MDGEYYNENQYGTPYTKSSKEENDFLVNELVENPNSQTYQNNDAYQEINNVNDNTGYQYTNETTDNTGYQYQSDAADNTGYQYQNDASKNTSYQYQSDATDNTGYQYQNEITDNTGYQYQNDTTDNTGYQYQNETSDNTGYQYQNETSDNTAYQYQNSAVTPAIQNTIVDNPVVKNEEVAKPAVQNEIDDNPDIEIDTPEDEPLDSDEKKIQNIPLSVSRAIQPIQKPQIIQPIQKPQIIQPIQKPPIIQPIQKPQIFQTVQNPQIIEPVQNFNSAPIYSTASVSSVRSNYPTRTTLVAPRMYSTRSIPVYTNIQPKTSINQPVWPVMTYPYQYGSMIHRSSSTMLNTPRYSTYSIPEQPVARPLVFPNLRPVGALPTLSLASSYNNISYNNPVYNNSMMMNTGFGADYSALYKPRSYRARSLTYGRRNY